MTYQELTIEIKEIKEQLIELGFIELIAPYFFLNVNPEINEVAQLKQLDQFTFLITINENVLCTVPNEFVKNILIQQMLHTCRGAQGESLRWRVLVKEVNQALNLDIPDQEYQLSFFVDGKITKQQNGNYSDGYIVAQACTACGYKNMVPNIDIFVRERTICPMCEQDTLIQVV